MKREIAFQTAPANAPNPTAPSRSSGPSYQDHTFEEPFRPLGLKFAQKITWARILPSIAGSKYHWILPFGQFKDNENRFPSFVDPATFGLPSVFAHASQWLRKNKPEVLQKKDVNPRGFKLWPGKRGIAWVVIDSADEGERLRLYHTSMYNGEWGGSVGAGHRLFDLAESVDNEPGSPTLGQKVYGDITDGANGRLVKIEKMDGGEFASYNISIGKNIAPLDLSILTDAEMELICPLEKTLKIPTEEEQKGYLRQYIGDELFGQIFP